MARTKTDVGRTDAGTDAGSRSVEQPRQPPSPPKTFPRGAPSVKIWQPGPDQAIEGGAGGGGGTGSGGGGGGGGRTSAVQRNPVSGKAGGLDFRQVFTGATLKKIMGLPTLMSDVIFGKVKNDSGVVTTVAPDRSDVYVAFIDVLSGIPGIGRLFSPGSIFWRLPKSGDSVTVLKHSDADGPGVPYVLHGDGGANHAVPSWLDSSNCGIAAPETIHIESGQSVIIRSNQPAGSTQQGGSTVATIQANSDGSITITSAAGANIKINAGAGAQTVFNNGSLAVARITDTVAANASMLAWITAVSGFFNAAAAPMVSGGPGTLPPPVGFGNINQGTSNVSA